jgi:hypothetical protein
MNFNEDLREISDVADSLGGGPHAEAVRDLAALLEDDSLRVVVFGEFSVGKSTLINALLGRAALPAKAMPTTGHATRIRFGNAEGVRVSFTDGRIESCPLDQIDSFVTLDLQSRARDGIEAIDLIIQAPLLRRGLMLIDTPGINDAVAQTRRAERAVMASDLVLLVLRANQMLGAEMRQRAAVWMTRELGKPVVPVLNGLNQVEDKDRSELRRLLGAWSRATLTPALGKPFFEVNAIGALRHALGISGAEPPADDFNALKAALEGMTGQARRELQSASRTHQARSVLRSAADWNRCEFGQLAVAADTLYRSRDERRSRLQRSIKGLESRRESEDIHVRALVGEELRRGWRRLAQKLAEKGKTELEQKSRRWFDTYLEKAVRTTEEQANERLAALAAEVDAPPPEPLTISQLVSLNQRTEVQVSTPDNSNAIAVGALGGAAAGAAIGSIVPVVGTGIGAAIGWVVGAGLADKATKQEPDYATAYTTAARTDWDKVAPTIKQSVRVQFKARFEDLVKGLRQQAGDLGRMPPLPEELQERRQLQGLLERTLERLGR